MIEVEKLTVSKDKILSTIRARGPSLPVQIAREIEFSPLFASAFLSELKSEGKIKLSNMRVGSSPLYYLQGQEDMLEKFVPYLNEREKEAFTLLKKNLVLEDSEQTPVNRVALRAIKDFAVPVKVRVKGESKLFWKHHSLTDEEVMERIDGGGRKTGEASEKPVEEKVPERTGMFSLAREDRKRTRPPASVAEQDNIKAENSGDGDGGNPKSEERKSEYQKNLNGDARPLAEKKQARDADNGFPIMVKDYLSRKEVEILHIVSEKKKEFEAKVRINTDFGKQNYYLIAKDKKSATDNDLAKAESRARKEKLPAVFMASGDLNKKGRAHLEQWGNLVRFARIEE